LSLCLSLLINAGEAETVGEEDENPCRDVKVLVFQLSPKEFNHHGEFNHPEEEGVVPFLVGWTE